MTLRIDGKPISELSLDEIGATLQQIASELSVRGNAAGAVQAPILLWAFNEVDELGATIRKYAWYIRPKLNPLTS